MDKILLFIGVSALIMTALKLVIERLRKVPDVLPPLEHPARQPPMQSIEGDDPVKATSHKSSGGGEGSFWDAVAPKSLKIDVFVNYADVEGNLTTRKVSVTAFDETCDMFTGFCHLRGATRTFRFSRVLDCADTRTGEMIGDFKGFCVREYANTSDHSLDKLVAENLDALRVAFFIGRRDGRLTKKELAEVALFSVELAGDQRLGPSEMRKIFDSLGEPSMATFRQAVGRIKSKDSVYKQKLIDLSNAMAATKRQVSPSEQEAIDYLNKTLGKSIF